MITLKFHGHATFQIYGAGQSILIDPWFRGNPEIGAVPDDLDPTLILVTHNHTDHVGDAIEISKRYKAPIVTTPSLARHYEGEGATSNRVHLGGRLVYDWGTIKCVPAFHDSPLAIGETWRVDLGAACGFVLTIDEVSIYHAGDTALYSDMQLFAPVDYALLPIDGKMVMEPADAVRAGRFLQARTLIPMHWRQEDPDAFAESARAAGFDSFAMSRGQTVELKHSS